MQNILQAHWNNSELVGLDSIVFADGSIRLIDISSIENKELKDTFGKEYQLHHPSETTLHEIIDKYDNDIWSVIQINDRVEARNAIFVCGEGEMGNEGFIAKLDKDGNIQWSLYSSTSNPFYKFIIGKDQLQALSTHGFAIDIALQTDDFTINNILKND